MTWSAILATAWLLVKLTTPPKLTAPTDVPIVRCSWWLTWQAKNTLTVYVQWSTTRRHTTFNIMDQLSTLLLITAQHISTFWLRTALPSPFQAPSTSSESLFVIYFVFLVILSVCQAERNDFIICPVGHTSKISVVLLCLSLFRLFFFVIFCLSRYPLNGERYGL